MPYSKVSGKYCFGFVPFVHCRKMWAKYNKSFGGLFKEKKGKNFFGVCALRRFVAIVLLTGSCSPELLS